MRKVDGVRFGNIAPPTGLLSHVTAWSRPSERSSTKLVELYSICQMGLWPTRPNLNPSPSTNSKLIPNPIDNENPKFDHEPLHASARRFLGSKSSSLVTSFVWATILNVVWVHKPMNFIGVESSYFVGKKHAAREYTIRRRVAKWRPVVGISSKR